MYTFKCWAPCSPLQYGSFLDMMATATTNLSGERGAGPFSRRSWESCHASCSQGAVLSAVCEPTQNNLPLNKAIFFSMLGLSLCLAPSLARFDIAGFQASPNDYLKYKGSSPMISETQCQSSREKGSCEAVKQLRWETLVS